MLNTAVEEVLRSVTTPQCTKIPLLKRIEALSAKYVNIRTYYSLISRQNVRKKNQFPDPIIPIRAINLLISLLGVRKGFSGPKLTLVKYSEFWL